MRDRVRLYGGFIGSIAFITAAIIQLDIPPRYLDEYHWSDWARAVLTCILATLVQLFAYLQVAHTLVKQPPPGAGTPIKNK